MGMLWPFSVTWDLSKAFLLSGLPFAVLSVEIFLT